MRKNFIFVNFLSMKYSNLSLKKNLRTVYICVLSYDLLINTDKKSHNHLCGKKNDHKCG
jgi:hypothetical protein